MKALLCLHGLLSSDKDFDFLKIKLQEEYDYIHTPVMPGHKDRRDSFSCRAVLDYAVEEYDRLRQISDCIDILGYSVGGVLACYLCQIRKVNRLILLAPAFNYINIKNYRPKIMKKSQVKSGDIFSAKKVQYFLTFTRIVHRVKDSLQYIPCPICIIWGEDDFLVSKRSGLFLYRISANEVKFFVTLKNHNHYNIVRTEEVVRIIRQFLDVREEKAFD